MIQLLNLEAVVCPPLSFKMIKLWARPSLLPTPRSDISAWKVIDSVVQRMSSVNVEVEAAANSLRKHQNASKTQKSKLLSCFFHSKTEL